MTFCSDVANPSMFKKKTIDNWGFFVDLSIKIFVFHKLFRKLRFNDNVHVPYFVKTKTMFLSFIYYTCNVHFKFLVYSNTKCTIKNYQTTSKERLVYAVNAE